ncbi:histidine kinase [Methylocystis sp. 9N]|uniref:Histidine kinase n=1 Tax=Methylocystis borbori TaxID=3118750 RepID=A0ABU7XJ73_9HYPH
MTQRKWPPQIMRRARPRRAARRREDPSTVFRTFVELLARLGAEARTASQTQLGAQAEKS